MMYFMQHLLLLNIHTYLDIKNCFLYTNWNIILLTHKIEYRITIIQYNLFDFRVWQAPLDELQMGVTHQVHRAQLLSAL